MADYGAVRDQLKVRLETVSEFVAVFDNLPDRVTVPCAIVRPGSPVADYHQARSGQGLTKFNFEILALAQRWEPNAGQDVLDGFISGSSSVEAAIRGDTTLGGEASTSQVTSCTAFGQVPVADSLFYGCTFNVEVFSQ